MFGRRGIENGLTALVLRNKRYMKVKVFYMVYATWERALSFSKISSSFSLCRKKFFPIPVRHANELTDSHLIFLLSIFFFLRVLFKFPRNRHILWTGFKKVFLHCAEIFFSNICSPFPKRDYTYCIIALNLTIFYLQSLSYFF